jgi:hypothetical protein
MAVLRSGDEAAFGKIPGPPMRLWCGPLLVGIPPVVLLARLGAG